MSKTLKRKSYKKSFRLNKNIKTFLKSIFQTKKKGLKYHYISRKKKKVLLKSRYIKQINSHLYLKKTNYSSFMHKKSQNKIMLNRSIFEKLFVTETFSAELFTVIL